MKTLLSLLLVLSIFGCETSDSAAPCIERVCGDFTYQEDAQEAFDGNPSCYENLDADSDGIPCEGLPKRP